MEVYVSQELLGLCDQLLKEGYKGTFELTNSYASGTSSVFGNQMVLSLSGFCKETLYLAVDSHDGEYIAVGRYSVINRLTVPFTVEQIVKMAWRKYQSYKTTGPYGIQSEWLDLYIKYGYVKEKITTVYEELK